METKGRDSLYALVQAERTLTSLPGSSTEAEKDTRPGTLEVMGALWRQETIIGNAVADYRPGAYEGDVARWDGDFNPYSYWAANKNDYADLEPLIKRGGVDEIYSESEFLGAATQYRKERADREIIERAGVGQILAGSLSTIADVTTLLPFLAPVKGAGVLSTATRAGLTAAAHQGIQETVLHQLQGERTIEESAFNTAFALALGGGFGAYAGGRSPHTYSNAQKAIDPATPPLEGIVRAGDGIEHADIFGPEGVTRAAEDPLTGVGAARALPDDSTLLEGGTRVGNLFRAVTPVGRALQWTSSSARKVLQSIYEIPLFTRGMARGETPEISAEALARDTRAALHATVAERDAIGHDLNIALGEWGHANNVRTKPLETPVLNEMIRRKVVRQQWQDTGVLHTEDEAWFQKIIEAHGYTWESVQPLIHQHTDNAARLIQKAMRQLEDRMVELGSITEEQRMGARYGMAQLWNRNAIIGDEAAYKEFLINILAKRPDETWLLENYGLTLEKFQDLPMTNPGGPSKADILGEWTGEAERLREYQLSAKLESATQKLTDAETDFAISGYNIGILRNINRLDKTARSKALKLATGEFELEAMTARHERIMLLEREVTRLDKETTTPANGAIKEQLAAELNTAREDLKNAMLSYERNRRRAMPDGTPMHKAAKERAQTRLKELDPQDFAAHIKERTAQLDYRQNVLHKLYEQHRQIEQLARLTRDYKKAARAYSRNENRPPLTEVVDHILSHYLTTDTIPNGFMKQHIGDGARAKERIFHLTDEEARYAEQKGYLHTDMDYILSQTYHDQGGRLALRERFGTTDLNEILRGVHDDYAQLIAKNPKKKQQFTAEKQKVIKDIEHGVNMLTGRNMSGEHMDNLLTWGLSKLRQATFMRFVAGFPLSSLADLASVVLHTAFGRGMFRYAKEALRMFRDTGIDPNAAELKSLLRACEHTLNPGTIQLGGLDALQNMGGIGPVGSRTRSLTEAIDKGMTWAVNRANTWSGQLPLTLVGKSIAVQTTLAELARKLPGYGTLSKLDTARFASVGIGRQEAETLSRFMTKYGQWEGDSFVPNAHLWHAEPGGGQAHRTLRLSLGMIANRAVITPGIGDMPRLAATGAIGKLLFQFQSFGFASVNRFMTPFLQRTVGYSDWARPAAAFITLATLSAFNMAVRAYIRGDDLTNYSPEKFTKEWIDRAGLLFYAGPSVNILWRIAGVEGSSRYRNSDLTDMVLGPAFSTGKTALTTGYHLSRGELDQAGNQAKRIMPFMIWGQLGGAIAKSIKD